MQIETINPADDLVALESVQDYIDTMRERFAALGMSLSISHSFDDWAEIAKTHAADLGVSGTVDPAMNAYDGFWVKLEETGTGAVVALQVDRLIETDDFVRKWLVTGRLYHGRQASLDWRSQALQGPLPRLSGLILFLAGMWVNPDYRRVTLFEGLSIAKAVSLLGRCIALTNYYVDSVVAFVEDDGKTTRPARGLAHRVPLIRGYYEGRGREQNLDLHWSNRAEMLASVPALGSSSTRMAMINRTTAPDSSTVGNRARR